jgi:hypothetical protein
MPDVIFSNQKSQFGSILEALGMENVGIFGPFGIFYDRPVFVLYGHLLILWSFFMFSPFWYIAP